MTTELTGHALREYYQRQVNTGALSRQGLLLEGVRLGWTTIQNKGNFISFQAKDHFRFRIYFEQGPGTTPEPLKPETTKVVPRKLEAYFYLLIVDSTTSSKPVVYFGHTHNPLNRLATHETDDLAQAKTGVHKNASEVFALAAAEGLPIKVAILDYTSEPRFVAMLRSYWMSVIESRLDSPVLKRVPAHAKVYEGPEFMTEAEAKDQLDAALAGAMLLDQVLEMRVPAEFLLQRTTGKNK